MPNKATEKPKEYTNVMPKNSSKKLLDRVVIFTPTTGMVRIEWVRARYGQVIPTNWSNTELTQPISSYIPVEYQLADAQNLLAKFVVERDFEWVIYVEHDNVIPPDGFIRFNEYMIKGDIPVVSGLYFTKSEPPEPILYRGRGNGHYANWKMGNKVWVDGIPFGFRLEHASLIKMAWRESPEYTVGNVITRRVFHREAAFWFDEHKGLYISKTGTTDLAWCSRIMDEHLFDKAGWPEYQSKRYPFLVDTNIFVKHIDNNGVQYPLRIPDKYLSNAHGK